ncbi:hypothetical protein ACFUN8_05255 [Streptomyces sp. NPDC057307]|uniref:hypothetical protein n=1 Tax=Streptomyces sp. NPDC057307 TaxID=3346096 RepID=UPI0036322088
MNVQARKPRARRASPAPMNSRVRRTAWGVRQRAAGVLSALLLGVVTLVSPAPASALGTMGASAGAAAATPVQRTLPQQADRPTRAERSRDVRGQSPRAASTPAGLILWAPGEQRTQQHSPQPDSGALPVPTALSVPRAVVERGAPAGVAAPTTNLSGLPDVRGPPSGSSHPHCPVSAPVHRPR